MKTFSLQTAQWLAPLAQFAYGETKYPGAPYKIISIDSAADIHAKLIQFPRCNVLTFEGTHDARNWFTDAAIGLREWGPRGMKIHWGALQAYLSIDGAVLKALDAAPAVPLWITGHSLGAWLACLCGFSLAYYHSGRWSALHETEIHDDIAGIYGFGCPRLFNRAGARAYDRLLGDRTWRITHALDPIPHIPWAAPGWRSELYWKTKNHVWIDDSGFLDVNRSFWRELPHAWRCALQEEMRGELAPMPDHSIARYIAALNQVKI
ncbi:MAG TPA: hypothetical protein VMQ76_10835 [Terracidiphilus sp.]|nr:hypothetical protein [Terracidiphilus sp.]